MLEERIIELIHRDLDREIDESERGELRARLECDPDARLFYDEMKSVAELLQGSPANDPPADFAASVMTSVRASAVPRPAHTSFIPFPRRYGVLPLGLGLAAAVLIAFFVAPSLFRSVDSTHVGGTMLEPPSVEEPQTWSTAAGGVKVSARGESVEVRVEAAPNSTRIAELTFNANGLRLESIENAAEKQSEPGHVEVSVRGSAAAVKFVRLTREPVSLTVNSHGEGIETFNGRIEIPASSNY